MKALFALSAMRLFSAPDADGGMPAEAQVPSADASPTPAPAAPKAEKIVQNGVTRPGAGSKTGQVWDIADALSAQHMRPALREEVMAAGEAAGLNRGTIATQYARWTEFHGVTKEQRAAAREASKPAKPEPAKPEPAPAESAPTEQPETAELAPAVQ